MSRHDPPPTPITTSGANSRAASAATTVVSAGTSGSVPLSICTVKPWFSKSLTMARKSGSAVSRSSVMTSARCPIRLAIRPRARRCPLPTMSSRGDLIVPKCVIVSSPYCVSRRRVSNRIIYDIVFDIGYSMCEYFCTSRKTVGRHMEALRENRAPSLRPHSVVDGVYDIIYERLMSLAIAPGARIPIDVLARDLDVSQTPVREALSRLEREGLVNKAHLIG